MSSAPAISSPAPTAAIVRQPSTRDVANSPSTDPNASSTAAAPPAGASGSVDRAAGGTPAIINSISADAAPRSDPGAAASAPATPPDADPMNQIAQQNAVSQKNAAIAKAIQSGSSAISSFLDIKV